MTDKERIAGWLTAIIDASKRRDDDALALATMAIVGNWIEQTERQTQALEKIANMAEGVTYGNVTINVVHRD